MGRRSRSPPHSSRRRSGSRSPKRHQDPNRHHKDKKSSNLKGMEEAKRRMREGLESAVKTEVSSAPSCAPRPFEDLSHAEQASRAREIERIDEGGFQQTQFKSSMGGGRSQKKHQTKAERVETAQDHHEKAIFGPAWMNKEIKKEERTSLPPLPSSLTAPTRQGPPLLHSNFRINPEKRKADWLNTWKEQRRVLGINC